MNYVAKHLIVIVALIGVIALVGTMASAGTVINQMEISGTGLTTGYTSLLDSSENRTSIYSDNLFAVGATYSGTNYHNGLTGYVGNKQISGTNLRYSETVGYQGVTKTKLDDAPCAQTDVNYKNINAGSQYNLDSGSIKTGAEFGTNDVGYMTTGNGIGSGTVWNSITQIVGTIGGCGDAISKALTQTGTTNYGSTYTANGNIDIASLFKFSW